MLRSNVATGKFQLHDFVIMPDHLHLLMTIPGNLTIEKAMQLVKGGFSVDVGVRAFMPASRSGVRDAAELEKLVGQEITCHIIKLDTTEEDVVVDRRTIVEEQARVLEQNRYAELKEGDIVSGQVRSLASYGAFIDLGGADGFLHIGEMSWTRVKHPSEVLKEGEQCNVVVLSIDREKQKIGLGMRQLSNNPWGSVEST